MRILLILVSAFFFSLGDYLCSVGGEKRKLVITLVGALFGAFGCLVFAQISKVVPLSSLAGYVNGVVVIFGVTAGVFLKKEHLSPHELFFLGIIVLGLLGLAYVQSQKI